MGTIVWEKGDGGIAISYVAEHVEHLRDYADSLILRHKIPEDYEVVLAVHGHVELPKYSDIFFNALVWRTGLKIDLKKAREIKKDILRIKRIHLFKDLDSKFIQLIETGADTTAVVSEKQKLRDFPEVIDSINTVHELVVFDI